MANFRVWVEKTKNGWAVRHRDEEGKKHTDYPYVPHKPLAKELGKKVMLQYLNNEKGDSDLSLALIPLVEDFIQERETNNYSRNTINHNRNSLMHFICDNDLKTLEHVTHEVIKTWKYNMTKRGWANETIRGCLADVARFLNWLVEEGKLKTSPFGKKMLPKRKDLEPKYYTVSEYQALDKALAEISPETRLLCALAHSAGLRKGEALGVKMEDISWLPNGEGVLLIRKEVAKGKTKSRPVPLDAGILELIGSRRPGLIVQITRNQADHFFQRARKAAGINPDLDIHGLRHTFAKNYLQHSGKGIRFLQELLGHSSLMSTMIYSQFDKAYLNESIHRVYEARKLEEKLAGQISLTPVLQGNLGTFKAKTMIHTDSYRTNTVDKIDSKVNEK